jgi:hypothetical protein
VNEGAMIASHGDEQNMPFFGGMTKALTQREAREGLPPACAELFSDYCCYGCCGALVLVVFIIVDQPGMLIVLLLLLFVVMAGNGHFLPGGKVSYGASRP